LPFKPCQLHQPVRLAGIRYDRFDYDIENLKFRDADTGYHSSVTMPKLGLIWAPTAQFELFTAATEPRSDASCLSRHLWYVNNRRLLAT
jgi:hypothetical protein